MTIDFRADRGWWRYSFRHNGERHQGKVIDPDTGQAARNETEAKRIEAKIRSKLPPRGQGPAPLRLGAFTLAEAAELYLATVEGRHLRDCQRHVQEILVHFGATTAVTDLNLLRVEQYKAWMKLQPVRRWTGGPTRQPARHRPGTVHLKVLDRRRSLATCNRYLNALSGMLTAAHQHQDPATGQRALPFPPRIARFHEAERQPTPIADSEIDRLLPALPSWARDASEMMDLFGLRAAEALGARLSWIEWQLKGLRLPGEIVKSRKEQFQPAGPAGMALLQRLARQAETRGTTFLVSWPGSMRAVHALARAERTGQDPVKLEIDWQPLKSFRRSWTSAKRAAGLTDGRQRRIHDLRAAYITRIARDSSAQAAKDAARHASMSTTQRYIALVEGDVHAAVRQAELRRARSAEIVPFRPRRAKKSLPKVTPAREGAAEGSVKPLK